MRKKQKSEAVRFFSSDIHREKMQVTMGLEPMTTQ